MQARNYQLAPSGPAEGSPELQMEQRQQQLIQMQNYFTQMQVRNYQPAPSGPAEGSPELIHELQPEQGEAHEVVRLKEDHQMDLRPKKLIPNVI
ncbi:MAG: hypothetical protein EZS28_016490 [Streblomastix strix]|uniref:Uncharacterized protein n=1 Tax=Streblomastix strix TaxID=222440 RepID=A0A5J4VZJ6_9EUKA|nr:MAG: hypothetical protein EZS28_016490 [Streblomastix strix]